MSDPHDFNPPQGNFSPPPSEPSMSLEEAKSKKMLAGIFGILLGGFGIHKFILGYKTEGLIMLLVTLCTCFIGSIVMQPIGLIEGIMYLVKSD